jgi:hypothetical protein
VRNNKLQEGKKHHQAAHFAKADKGHPSPAKQEHEELKMTLRGILWIKIGHCPRDACESNWP